jgi:hypothetical protein
MPIPERQAGYLELSGARKDSECRKVDVKGGVSKQRGCCDYFEPTKPSVDGFRCGTCGHVVSKSKGAMFGQ